MSELKDTNSETPFVQMTDMPDNETKVDIPKSIKKEENDHDHEKESNANETNENNDDKNDNNDEDNDDKEEKEIHDNSQTSMSPETKTEQTGLNPNKFLKRFSNISKTLNTNPAVVRAGIVLQSAAEAGIFQPRSQQQQDEESDNSSESGSVSSGSSASSSSSSASSSSSLNESEESSILASEKDDNHNSSNGKANESEQGKTMRNIAEAAASTAAAVTSAAVASASAAASSSVASGFRGRYALFGSPPTQTKSDPSSSTSSSSKLTVDTSLPVSSPPSSNVYVNANVIHNGDANTNNNGLNKIKSPGSGLLNAISKRGNRIIAKATHTPSPAKPLNRQEYTGTRSQTSLILNSSAGPHMQKILSTLNQGEYVMFLGPGFMGVNLKQSFQKGHGVYVDYIVPNGAADKSGVVGVGDCLLKVGNVDVTNGTIRNVPGIIAQTERPVIIVLQRDFPVTGGPMDVAIGKVLQVQHAARGGITGGKLLSDLPITDTTPEEGKQMEEAGDNKDPQDPNENNLASPYSVNQSPYTPKSSVKTFSYHRQNSNLNKLPSPSRSVKASLTAYANKRSNEMSSFAALARAASHDDEFRDIIASAFYACCLDSRCLTFVASHFSGEDSYDYYAESNGVINSNDKKSTSPKASSTPPTSSIRLMLYLEILSFEELFGVTPLHRHRDHAKRVAQKFLIPSVIPNSAAAADSYTPPMFDLRSALPPALLHQVAKTISDESTPIARDFFQQCKMHIQESLCGNRFANFLISNECARMRAYLRGTNHYRHIPVEDLWSGLKLHDPNACNYFLYALLHFLCWSDEVNESIHNAKGRAIAGICTALFIQREFMKHVQNGTGDKEKIIASFEQLWQTFLTPNGGMLDGISHSNECQEALDHARAVVMKAIAQPYLVKALLSEEVSRSLSKLSEELLFDYAVNMHSKFKESVAHELVCFELRDHQKETYDGIPEFPNGCIARLVRKSHFPASVSTHKPRRVDEIIESETNVKETNQDIQREVIEEVRTSRSLVDQLDKEADDNQEDLKESTNENESEKETEATVTQHKNKTTKKSSTQQPLHPSLFNADFAVVFGSDDAAAGISHDGNGIQVDQMFVKRFATVPVGILKEANIPTTLESYAVVPAFREKSTRFRTSSSRISDDGWEASLINYIVPNPSADNPSRCIYGVSLVLHQRDQQHTSSPTKNRSPTQNIDTFVSASPSGKGDEKTHANNDMEVDEGMVVFEDQGSPLFRRSPMASPPQSTVNKVGDNIRRMLITEVTPDFSRKLGEHKWSETLRRGGNTIGITLISSRNVIPAMRSSLSQFFDSLTKCDETDDVPSSPIRGKSMNGRFFAPLVDIFGNFSMPGVNNDDLRRMLYPYIQSGSKTWVDRPLSLQSDHFKAAAGKELLQCLPPIPLALLFIAALLEQKIVFSSSRRSVLLSACTALTDLLHPIEWSHLLVPLVPVALSHDLIQYPAPYLIGIPSDDSQSMSLLNSLPPEVTLVDLDVGRVILASSFANESNKVNATTALRSQMLRLAEILGDVFGGKLSEETWFCDDPFPSREAKLGQPSTTPYQRVKNECSDFITELLTGSSSCCFWVEEHASSSSESTVLFDEDRFLHLKNLREQGHYMPLIPRKNVNTVSTLNMLGFSNHLALCREDFDLILKSFLRTQGMSTFISSLPKTSMAFW